MPAAPATRMRLSSALRAERGNLVVVGDDLLGQHKIRLQQSLGRAFHRNSCQPAHFPQLGRQLIELLVVRGSHGFSLRSGPSDRPEVEGERQVNATCPDGRGSRIALWLFAGGVGRVGDGEIFPGVGGPLVPFMTCTRTGEPLGGGALTE